MNVMHRPEKEIRDRGEIEAVLREAEVGRLGTCSGGEPYVVPLQFAYHDGRVVFHCARRGKKLENIARNPRVCFEVDSGEVIASVGISGGRKDSALYFEIRHDGKPVNPLKWCRNKPNTVAKR